MELKQPAYCVRGAELGSFTRAALALDIAQPVLSLSALAGIPLALPSRPNAIYLVSAISAQRPVTATQRAMLEPIGETARALLTPFGVDGQAGR